MVDCLVAGVLIADPDVALEVIGVDCLGLVPYGPLDESVESGPLYVGDALQADVAAPLVLCSQSFFRFADLGDDGLCRGDPDKGWGVIVSAIDVVVDRFD